MADELTGTLAKVKELGYITIGHREASVPFSYLDDKRQPVGFAIDICAKIVDAVKRELKLDKLEVQYQLVTASSRAFRYWPTARSTSNAATPPTTPSGNSRSGTPIRIF